MIIFVYLQRGDNIPKVLVFTEDGYFLRAWNSTVDTPHGMFATNSLDEQAIWITDVGSGMYTGITKLSCYKLYLCPCSFLYVLKSEFPI